MKGIAQMEIDKFTVKITVCPSDSSMDMVLAMLNVWQEANPDKMVALVPAREKYQYEIIQRGSGENG